ncbi:MAG: DNA recombination protein RmuC [Dehalococcoidia bacterium]|nr:DNA recombination protein RmuC [Dehalococcoidia bacterium]
MELIIGLAVGLAVGGVACWFVQGYRSKARMARLEGRLEQAATTNDIMETAKRQMNETFQVAAGQALRNNNELFMNVAKESLGRTLETARGEFGRRHEQFQSLVKPLSERYEKLAPQIESLMQQNQTLTAETGRLSNALTNNRQIGSWGEVQLRRVVELAGMTEHCDFVEQSTVSPSGDRPDLMVKLPERRTVVVDAKASTAAYMEAQQTDDEAAGADALNRHAGALRTQVDALAGKNYGAKVDGALDFVVMFVPGDQFLAAALRANPNLVEYAMGKRVAIATPASLISLLWAVANGWQRYRIAENAEAIREAGEELHRRMQSFIERYQRVGKELESAVKAYNLSIGSFDSRVVPQGRRFTQLVINDEDSFNPPDTIDQAVSESRYTGTLPSPEDQCDQPEARDPHLPTSEAQ